jgi:hypothetical protein
MPAAAEFARGAWNSESRAIYRAAARDHAGRRGILFQNVRAPPDIVCGYAGAAKMN